MKIVYFGSFKGMRKSDHSKVRSIDQEATTSY